MEEGPEITLGYIYVCDVCRRKFGGGKDDRRCKDCQEKIERRGASFITESFLMG